MIVKKYQGHIRHEKVINRNFTSNFTQTEKVDYGIGDGAYMFIPEWRNPLPTKYGKLSQDVIYQKGALIE